MKYSRNIAKTTIWLAMITLIATAGVLAYAVPGDMATIAGNGEAGHAGDGGTAASAQLYFPRGSFVDALGNIYIADTYNHRIRKIDVNALISTVAGNGIAGFSGDGGQATLASLSYPNGIFVSADGTLYIADSFNDRIRKVDAGGIISTVAGSDETGYAGDGGQAALASLNYPTGVIGDGTGNIYIADMYNQCIRMITTNGAITTIAGNGMSYGGYGGDGGPAIAASLFFPRSIAFDIAGNLLIADEGNSRIRKIDANGSISTIAGGACCNLGDNGPATQASLYAPSGVAADHAGNIYVAEFGNQRVRKIDTSGTIVTIAGNGTMGFSGDGGPAALSVLSQPTGVFVDTAGSVLIADSNNSRVRVIEGIHTKPAAFFFTDATNVAVSTVVVSNTITVSGINAPSPLSIAGGEYEINSSGLWSTATGTVNNNDTIRVRVLSSQNYSTTMSAALAVGGITGTFNVTTVALAPVSAVTLSASPLSPGLANTPVTITATATGVGSNKEYQFAVKDPVSGVMTVLQPYGPSNVFSYTPIAAGAYSIRVYARNAGSTATYEAARWLAYSVILDPLVTDVTITASPSSPQVVNTPVTFTATAIGGGANKAYEFAVKDPVGGVMAVIQPYGPSNKFPYIPTAVGTYSIRVYARNADSAVPYEAARWSSYTVVNPPVTSVNLSGSPATQQVNADVLFAATATGGGANKEYEFAVKDPVSGVMTVLRAYGPSNTFLYTPAATGTYNIRVYARNYGNPAAYEAARWMSYPVIADPPVASVTLAASPASPQANTPVTFAATATGGGANKEYQFAVQVPGGVMTVFQPYGPSNTFQYTPAIGGTHTIRVFVRNVNSTVPYEAARWLTCAVMNPPVTDVTVTASPAGSQEVNAPVTFTALATGGAGTCEYRFQRKDPGSMAYAVMQDYSTSNVLTWNTTGQTAGAYTMLVQARNRNSQATYEASGSLDYSLVRGSPNILLTMDVSGSMAWQAYSYGDADLNGDGVLDHYDPAAFYAGYFDPGKSYKVVNGIYEEAVPTGMPCTNSCISWVCRTSITGSCDARGTHGCGSRFACCSAWNTAGDCGLISGNYLNYGSMARIDLVRWALTGGKPVSCGTGTGQGTTGSYCDPEAWADAGNETKVGSVCNNSLDVDGDGAADGGCILAAYDGTQVKVRWERITGVNPVSGMTGTNSGLIYQFARMPVKPRIGAMFFEGTGVRPQKVYLGDFITASSKTAYDFYNVITMVNAHDPANATATGPAMWDALNYFAMKPPQYGGFAQQVGSADRWKNPMYSCQNGGIDCVFRPYADNYVLLLSDGQWNEGGNPGSLTTTCSIDTGAPYYSADPVVPAYMMHRGFMNVATTVPTGVRATYAVGMFVGGSGELAMKNIAMYGAFDESQRIWPGNLTGYPQMTCTAADCTGPAKGSPCTALPASSADWDANGDGVPDTFFSGSDGTQIKDAIMAAVLGTLNE